MGKYVYPSPARCPRCKTFDTEARRTDNDRGVQYRRCRRAICRWLFSVRGIAVEDETPPADESPFACPYCGKAYRRQSGLTRHIHRQHGDDHDRAERDSAPDDQGEFDEPA